MSGDRVQHPYQEGRAGCTTCGLGPGAAVHNIHPRQVQLWTLEPQGRLHPSHKWEKTPDPLLVGRAQSYGKEVAVEDLAQCANCMIQSFEPGAEDDCILAEETRPCICADPENCTQTVPGYVCRKRWPNVTVVKGETIDHPAHYGGADNPYEAIKVIEAWGLGFNTGNAAKYVCRAGKKENATTLEDLRKARWYLDREIGNMEAKEAKK